MGFKTDTSFLRFLSMGAAGVAQTMDQLRVEGFEPIELERYCASNKIWMTKVKRLRLPDVLCVRTGLRLEVRAKSDLKIRMSDAPTNPERRWDVGLRDDDLAAFIACFDTDEGPKPADEAVFFTIRALRESVGQSKLGPPKSASEGAERDREWPATIPSRSGEVLLKNETKLLVDMKGDDRPPRKQTYTLNGKNVYVKPGDKFAAGVSVLAGAPAELASLDPYRHKNYQPLNDLQAVDAVDRYAAVKALPYREDLRPQAVPALEKLLEAEQEDRVALEAAGAAATLGSNLGQERIESVLWGDGRADLRMEAVLILTELGSPFAKAELERVASDPKFEGDELRQAAVWGLGKRGLRAYEALLPFLDDPDENVALHAIAAFGSDTPRPVIEAIAEGLKGGNERRAAAASEALRVIGTREVAEVLAAQAGAGGDWILASLGRLPPAVARPVAQKAGLLPQIAPMLLLSEGANWLASEEHLMDIAFLLKQSL